MVGLLGGAQRTKIDKEENQITFGRYFYLPSARVSTALESVVMLNKILLCVLLAVSLECSAASVCKNGDFDSFKTAWKTFQSKSLNGRPEDLAELYAFPLTVTEGKQFGEVVQISRDSFVKNYDLIFRGQLKGFDANSSLIDSLKDAPDFKNMDQFDANGCSQWGSVGWDGYDFKWSASGAWLVSSVERAELKRIKKKIK